jgi:hypothetical protein
MPEIIVVVFVVEDVVNKRGCSLGPFADYVTIEAASPGCLAHELGHAVYPGSITATRRT